MDEQIDLGFDAESLPPPPWTREALGQDKFKELAEACGAGYSHAQRNPSIDPRSFAMGCANMAIARNGLALPQGENEKDEEYEARKANAEAYRAAGLELQEAINAKLPEGEGSTRDQSVGTLTPAATSLPASMRSHGFARNK